MKIADVNKDLIGRRCEYNYAGQRITAVITRVHETRYSVEVKMRYDKPQRRGDDIDTSGWVIGYKAAGKDAQADLRLLPEPAYQTLIVTFVEPINTLEGGIFDDPQAWGAATLKEWIDGYESTRFTPIGKCKAVITSEYNMESVREWLEKHTDIETLKTA